MTGTQAILPATLPTPAQARNNLRACRNEVKEKTNVAEGMKDRLDAAKEEEKEAAAEVEQAERDLLEADEDSKEEKVASVAHHKAWRRLERARLDKDKVKATLKLARGEARAAAKRLAAAREDLEAIREGKRVK